MASIADGAPLAMRATTSKKVQNQKRKKESDFFS